MKALLRCFLFGAAVAAAVRVDDDEVAGSHYTSPAETSLADMEHDADAKLDALSRRGPFSLKEGEHPDITAAKVLGKTIAEDAVQSANLTPSTKPTYLVNPEKIAEDTVLKMQADAKKAQEDAATLDPCRCNETWVYPLDNNTYHGCAETTDWPGHSWCYVQGGEACPTAHDSLLPEDNHSKVRQCQSTQDLKKGKEVRTLQATITNALPPGDEQKADMTMAMANMAKIAAGAVLQDPCRCMDSWEYTKDKKTYTGCASTPDYPGHHWCYVMGGAKCKTAKDSEIGPQEKRKFRECTPGEETSALPARIAVKMVSQLMGTRPKLMGKPPPAFTAAEDQAGTDELDPETNNATDNTTDDTEERRLKKWAFKLLSRKGVATTPTTTMPGIEEEEDLDLRNNPNVIAARVMGKKLAEMHWNNPNASEVDEEPVDSVEDDAEIPDLPLNYTPSGEVDYNQTINSTVDGAAGAREEQVVKLDNETNLTHQATQASRAAYDAMEKSKEATHERVGLEGHVKNENIKLIKTEELQRQSGDEEALAFKSGDSVKQREAAHVRLAAKLEGVHQKKEAHHLESVAAAATLRAQHEKKIYLLNSKEAHDAKDMLSQMDHERIQAQVREKMNVKALKKVSADWKVKVSKEAASAAADAAIAKMDLRNTLPEEAKAKSKLAAATVLYNEATTVDAVAKAGKEKKEAEKEAKQLEERSEKDATVIKQAKDLEEEALSVVRIVKKAEAEGEKDDTTLEMRKQLKESRQELVLAETRRANQTQLEEPDVDSEQPGNNTL